MIGSSLQSNKWDRRCQAGRCRIMILCIPNDINRHQLVGKLISFALLVQKAGINELNEM